MELNITDEICHASKFMKALRDNSDMNPEISFETAAIVTFFNLPPKELVDLYQVDPEYIMYKAAVMSQLPLRNLFGVIKSVHYRRKLLETIPFQWKKIYIILDTDAPYDASYPGDIQYCDLVDRDGSTSIMASCKLKNGRRIHDILIHHTKHPDFGTVPHKVTTDFNIDHVNKDGNTALMLACMEQMESTAKLLIQMGCDINVVNKEGDDAMSIATKMDLSNIVRLLKRVKES